MIRQTQQQPHSLVPKSVLVTFLSLSGKAWHPCFQKGKVYFGTELQALMGQFQSSNGVEKQSECREIAHGMEARRKKEKGGARKADTSFQVTSLVTLHPVSHLLATQLAMNSWVDEPSILWSNHLPKVQPLKTVLFGEHSRPKPHLTISEERTSNEVMRAIDSLPINSPIFKYCTTK